MSESTVQRLTRELEQARDLAVALEGENAHLAARCSELETERDEYLEALRSATARVFDERRKILPLRLDRDTLQANVDHLRSALSAAEHRIVDLEEQAGRAGRALRGRANVHDDPELHGIADALAPRPSGPVARVRRSVISTEPACGVPHPNRADLRCGRHVGHGGGHADPEVVGALWHEEAADA